MRATHRIVPATAILGLPAAIPVSPACAGDGIRTARPTTIYTPLNLTFDPGLPGNVYAPRAAGSRTPFRRRKP
jgi:hypothetical protein